MNGHFSNLSRLNYGYKIKCLHPCPVLRTLNIVTNLVLLQAIISLARSTIRLLVSNNACFDLMFGLQGHKWCQPTLLVKLGSSFTGNLLLRWTLSLYGPYSFNGNLNNKENKECYIYIYIYICNLVWVFLFMNNFSDTPSIIIVFLGVISILRFFVEIHFQDNHLPFTTNSGQLHLKKRSSNTLLETHQYS